MSKGIDKYNIKVKTAFLSLLLVMTFLFRLYPFYQCSYKVLHGDDARGFSDELTRRAGNNSIILTELPVRTIKYYNRDIEIRPLEDIGVITNKEVHTYNSVFIVYWEKTDKVMELVESGIKGFDYKGDYSEYSRGFLLFQKAKERS